MEHGTVTEAAEKVISPNALRSRPGFGEFFSLGLTASIFPTATRTQQPHTTSPNIIIGSINAVDKLVKAAIRANSQNAANTTPHPIAACFPGSVSACGGGGICSNFAGSAEVTAEDMMVGSTPLTQNSGGYVSVPPCATVET